MRPTGPAEPSPLVARAPGRVVLMGDHTDHTEGLVLAMAVDLETSVRGRPGGDRVRLRSTWAGPDDVVDLVLEGLDRAGAGPAPAERGAVRWHDLAAAVATRVGPTTGFEGIVETTLPVGAGLASSASFELAVALALGFEGSAHELAALGRAAEQAATGVPCGIMDQLAAASGVAGHALRIDCGTGEVASAPVPEDLEVVVVHSGVHRTLADTPYAARVADLRAAEAVVGPLRAVALADLAQLGDRTLRRRARHVLTENARVDATVEALRAADRPALRELLAASHASLRDDLEVSVTAVDDLVATLVDRPGVVGARVTGAGFGGCVVAIVEPGTGLPDTWTAWRVRAADGATCAGAGRPSWPRTRRR